MGSDNFYIKQTSINFTVKNISSDHRRIRVFNYPLEYGQSRDLLMIPDVSESDIRESLIKGELANKLRSRQIQIVSSSIDLNQQDPQQKQFLIDSGLTNSQIDPVSLAPGLKPTLFFIPGGTPSGDTVSTWSDLMSEISSSAVPLTIYIDTVTHSSGLFNVPAGTWNMKNAKLIGPINWWQTDNIIKVSSGAVLKNLAYVSGGLTLDLHNTVADTSLLTWDVAPGAISTPELIVTDFAALSSSGTVPGMIVGTEHNFGMTIRFLNNGGFASTGSIGIRVKPSGFLAITAYNDSYMRVPYVAVADDATSFLSLDIEGNLYLQSPSTAFPTFAIGSIQVPGFPKNFAAITSDINGMQIAKAPGSSYYNLDNKATSWWSGNEWRTASAPIKITSNLTLYISNSTGSDTNTGLVGHPLKTWNEFVNRYGVSPIISNSAILTINFLDAIVSDDITFEPIILSGSVIINGTPTQVGSGTFTSSPTQRNKATNTYLEVTDTAQTWASFVGTTIIHNTTHDGYAWIAKDTGSHKARLTSFMTGSTSSFFGAPTEITSAASGDSYTLLTPTKFTGHININPHSALDFGGGSTGSFYMQFIDIAPPTASAKIYNDGGDTLLIHCRISTTVFFAGTQLINCWQGSGGGSISFLTNHSQGSMYGGGTDADNIFANPGSFWLANGYLNQGKRLFVNNPGALVYLSDYMAADWAIYAIQVNLGGTLLANGVISGSSATAGTFVINVKCGNVVNSSGTAWATAIPATGADATVGNGFKMGISGFTQGAPYSAGALLAETTYTFAHLDAAVGAGTGFGGGTSRIDCYATMSKG